ncbi:hypothetical protein [Streptomyces bugieae]|uniref:Uncharacterized protein n=1 Tax=Streptomyces bugieae TaxID=3098223 RepID=A0ABU7NWD6_9ACTN|nr:hypothetical protein [Streptomyces sp. DSM 41528]
MPIYDGLIDGTGADGNHVRIEGTATDIVRRGTDGRYRHIIDNLFGIQRRGLGHDVRGRFRKRTES